MGLVEKRPPRLGIMRRLHPDDDKALTFALEGINDLKNLRQVPRRSLKLLRREDTEHVYPSRYAEVVYPQTESMQAGLTLPLKEVRITSQHNMYLVLEDPEGRFSEETRELYRRFGRLASYDVPDGLSEPLVSCGTVDPGLNVSHTSTMIWKSIAPRFNFLSAMSVPPVEDPAKPPILDEQLRTAANDWLKRQSAGG